MPTTQLELNNWRKLSPPRSSEPPRNGTGAAAVVAGAQTYGIFFLNCRNRKWNPAVLTKGKSMTTRRFVSLIAVTGTIAAASPALGQEMTYGDGYEYAQTAPADSQPVVYTQQPVVQPLPADPAPGDYVKTAAGADYAIEEYEVEYETGPQPAPPTHGAAGPNTHHMPNHHRPHHAAYPHAPTFDRAAWLEECEERYADAKGKGDGDVVGGILGAATGGLLGNRIAGRGDRLAGTLIGAGVGGLAGLAVGSVIDAAGQKRKRGEAAAYCEDWLARYSGGYQYPGYYGYAYYPAYYQQMYILVPHTVAVPQRAVVREYVTEEYVDVPVTTYETVPGKRHIKEAPAPKPVKGKLIKQYRKTKGQ